MCVSARVNAVALHWTFNFDWEHRGIAAREQVTHVRGRSDVIIEQITA